MLNEYLAEYERVKVDVAKARASRTSLLSSEFDKRRGLVRKYSWAIPNAEALDTIASFGPIVEMGAGTGYWAALLRARGVRVDAFDIEPPTFDGSRKNHYHDATRTWTHVTRGSVEKLSAPALAVPLGGYLRGRLVRDRLGVDKRTLMLCWPPYSDSFASKALAAFRGNRVVYIGEGGRGCTGDDAFHETLDRDWIHERNVHIPQWDEIHDYLGVFRRNV